jgi:P-type E1-E2 ATPase
MLHVKIPGRDDLELQHLVLDVNGTLALDGALLTGVAERLDRLSASLQLHLLTADTHGRQREIDAELNLRATILTRDAPEDAQKADYVRRLGARSVAAIGNGVNDGLMLREAALAIAVLGREGLAAAALREADVIAASIEDALDLLLRPRRLAATLRR